ncbi:MAG TPA: TnpV protein [Clostridiales bacterium]|nr:TnpV protein [Clostridiales bacterium]
MKSEKLEKEYTDEKTGISYTLVGDYYMPNLILDAEEKITLNKYGLLRLDYLKKHKKAEYIIMFMDKKLNKHLKDIQEIAQERVNELVEQLKTKSDLTEDMKNTDMLYWVGTMNAIKNQAEEIVLKELIYI